ncbi:TPA: hypothetical protein ACGPBP_005693, partial [Klebsiella variicola]
KKHSTSNIKLHSKTQGQKIKPALQGEGQRQGQNQRAEMTSVMANQLNSELALHPSSLWSQTNIRQHRQLT